MKKTSLRKNRLSDQSTRLPGSSFKRERNAKRRRSGPDVSGDGVSLHDMLMEQWAFNDDDIAERLAASVGKRISPEVQAYYDRMFALTHASASACEDGETPAALSDAA
ncbi:hypothetical protein [Massilia sp. CCM 8734]|uniref:hypothetical protein n=1 Tax=Massilia sp. CCM 8734 TaxID=2609283 RepID=UPI001423F6A5|nr:hypothetical protein [Massilia sp. CCM 8734]NHZ95077.1 hypothetical protein [Massilia sp. CCM 8734]